MFRRILRRLLPTSILVGLALLVGGVAYAYWSGSGGGTGAATTATTEAVTLTPGTPDASLYPGGEADVVLTVSNPNASAVYIGSLALDAAQGTSGFSVDSGHFAAGCTVAAATLRFTTQTNSGVGWSVPANGSLPVVLAGSLGMGQDAASACQGAVFSVYLAAGP